MTSALFSRTTHATMTNTELTLDQLQTICGAGPEEREARREARRQRRAARRERRQERRDLRHHEKRVKRGDFDNPGGCGPYSGPCF